MGLRVQWVSLRGDLRVPEWFRVASRPHDFGVPSWVPLRILFGVLEGFKV